VEQVLPGSGAVVGRGGEGVAQIMYTHVSKCKNDKIKGKKTKKSMGTQTELHVAKFTGQTDKGP
jgi:hypothetical protein